MEKRLAEKRELQRQSEAPGSQPTSPTLNSPTEGSHSTPRSSLTSPEPPSTKNGDKRKSAISEKDKEEEEEVEILSDMMCSLVTNNCGETRYIGGWL